MDWKQIEGNWKLLKTRIKKKWGKLTDDDLNAIDGRRNQLEKAIRGHYGFSADHVRKEIDDWLRWQTLKPQHSPGAISRTDIQAMTEQGAPPRPEGLRHEDASR
jgi:uncharacterized protein YjbJ (UPF0337 family)